ASGTTGNVILQIATGHSARSIRRSPKWAVPLALCTVVLFPFALRGGRKHGWLVALLLISFCGLVSCAGSGGGSGGTTANGQGGSSSTAGTYSIPVDVAADGVSHTITLTLTVD